MMTSRALAAIASNRGARCCKRSTFVAIEAANQYFKEVLGVELEHIPVLDSNVNIASGISSVLKPIAGFMHRGGGSCEGILSFDTIAQNQSLK